MGAAISTRDTALRGESLATTPRTCGARARSRREAAAGTVSRRTSPVGCAAFMIGKPIAEGWRKVSPRPPRTGAGLGVRLGVFQLNVEDSTGLLTDPGAAVLAHGRDGLLIAAYVVMKADEEPGPAEHGAVASARRQH